MSNSELTDLIVSLQNEEKASLLTEGNAHVPSMQPPLKKKKKNAVSHYFMFHGQRNRRFSIHTHR